MIPQHNLGVVVIGRNEGERLRRCLLSVIATTTCIVYVDSGSTDESVEMSRSLSVDVLALDNSIPFTAARARNAGFARLLQLYPQLKFVQFIDGDCEIVSEWLEKAEDKLLSQDDIAVVSGRLRERFPEKSPYNRLCDMEWDSPIGETKMCGGIAMMRVAALQQVNGFNPNLIAGEEPELCVRLRQNDWKIFRIDAEMALHDAQMLHFSQWWKRSNRNGYAYAEGAWLHGKPPERHWVKDSLRIWFWGLILPVLTISLTLITSGIGLILLGAYPLLFYRIARNKQKEGKNAEDAYLYAFFCVLAKFPQLLGQIKFHVLRIRGQQSGLIEYKAK